MKNCGDYWISLRAKSKIINRQKVKMCKNGKKMKKCADYWISLRANFSTGISEMSRICLHLKREEGRPTPTSIMLSFVFHHSMNTSIWFGRVWEVLLKCRAVAIMASRKITSKYLAF